MHQSVDFSQTWLCTTKLYKTMTATPFGVTKSNDNVGRLGVIAYATLLHAYLINCHATILYIASLNPVHPTQLTRLSMSELLLF